jgi:Haemolymph juvenile hormone binding protein (JHBP)
MQVLTLIEHYKQEDPVGIPGLPVPDPMPVPEIKKSLSLATLTMKNVLAYGLSKFRIKHVKTDLKDLNVSS